MPLLRKTPVPQCPSCQLVLEWDNLENLHRCPACTFTLHHSSIHDAERLTFLADCIHEHNVAVGWWDETVDDKYQIPTKIALAHSELSEALEGFRKDLLDDKLPHRMMDEVEYADAIIRILDICGRRGYDIGGAILEKRLYNAIRADHKPENRNAPGGKKI